MAELLAGKKLLKNGDGQTEYNGDVLKDKVVGLYFSAHWCPPCRRFTPLLKEFHASLEGDFEVVFCSSDNSEEQLKEYLSEAHGDWYYLPFEDDTIKELDEKYAIEGIPTLVIIKPNGDVIVEDAVEEVMENKPQDSLQKWKSA